MKTDSSTGSPSNSLGFICCIPSSLPFLCTALKRSSVAYLGSVSFFPYISRERWGRSRSMGPTSCRGARSLLWKARMFSSAGPLVALCSVLVVMSVVGGSMAEDAGKNDASSGAQSSAGSMSRFWTAFANSVAMIIATEIGDKTFFIAAIMAMSYPRLVVFGGAVGALAVMTVLSAALGYALPTFLPKRYTHYASALLFLYFGFRMLKEGMESQGGPSEELTEVEEELTKKSESGGKKPMDDVDIEGGVSVVGSGRRARKSAMEVMTMSFTMTFLAEWGDRSQIATIALATTKDPFGVTLGGIIGHSLCTGMAVVGGRMLAARISEKTVHLVGGALFLLFGLHAFIFGE